jgi:hypothetical protein
LPEKSAEKDLKRLSVILKFRAGQLLFGKNEAFDFIKDYDPVIQTALKRIADPKWL